MPKFDVHIVSGVHLIKRKHQKSTLQIRRSNNGHYCENQTTVVVFKQPRRNVMVKLCDRTFGTDEIKFSLIAFRLHV